MKLWLAVFAAAPLFAVPCSPAGPDSNCPAVITTTGNVAGTVPLVYAAANVSYSSMGNSAARLANYSYLAGDTVTATDGTICLGGPGGGDNSGDSDGDFLFSANGGASLIYPLQQGICRTIISYDYTKYSGGFGTNAPYPAPLSDDGCLLHWIAHDAGVLFPGNKYDIRRFAFSWGTHLAMDNSFANFSSTCEWSDPYAVRLMVLLSPVYCISCQWNGTYGSGGSTLDSTFAPAIRGAFSCATSPQASCVTASAPYDARTLWAAAANPVRIAMVVDGSTDTVTNPIYQGAMMTADMGVLNLPYVLEPGVPHGGTCHTSTTVAVTECWIELWRGLADNGTNSVAGSGSGMGGSSGGIF
ncbi:MAG TPA: hypothetical protein VHY84_27450 [Bryobacteraceae bacterium]|jgi:hypothetical protein|nr:hypothetical protein [Bryobacteraceae bacterium]